MIIWSSAKNNVLRVFSFGVVDIASVRVETVHVQVEADVTLTIIIVFEVSRPNRESGQRNIDVWYF